jgi:two-component system, cell cycle sensor histidine kinase and response regulator CckA
MHDVGRVEDESARVREQLTELRACLDALPLATVVKDRQGRFLYVNAAAAAGYGKSCASMIGGTERDLLPPGNHVDQVLAHDREVFDSGRSLSVPGQQFRTHDGRNMVLHLTRQPVRFGGEPALLVTAMDVTLQASAAKELRQLERCLAATQRLEGLGLMAGGIAHDFNNLLVGVLANAEMALRELSAGTRTATFVRRVKDAAERLAGLTRQLLAYSGRGPVEIEVIDLPSLAREALELVGSTISPTIQVEAVLPEGSLTVHGDRAQLTQVIMNLLINAAESIADRAGKITLTTRVEFLDSDRNASLAVRAVHGAAEYLCLEVRDNGSGMDEATRNRIFDPFFSTKAGPSRGLGLASVMGIVRAHQGALQVDSALGEGTRMRVWLPLARDKARVKRRQLPASTPNLDRPRVLIVDDEQVVRETTTLVLQTQGFTVHTAVNGDHAIELAKTESCDLVILDMSMPGRSVRDTHQALRTAFPDAPILLTSGYCEPATLNALLEQPATDFIQKPFAISELIERIQGLLRRPAAPASGVGR